MIKDIAAAYSTSEIAVACVLVTGMAFALICWALSYLPPKVFVKHGEDWQELEEGMSPPASVVAFQARRIENERVTLGTVVSITSYRKQE